MIKYFLKVTSEVTPENLCKHPSRIEYYGKRTEYLSSHYEPTNSDLKIFGFGSLKAAETAKDQKEKNYSRDDNKFHTWTHKVEILSREIN